MKTQNKWQFSHDSKGSIVSSVFPEIDADVRNGMYVCARLSDFPFTLKVWSRVHFMDADVHLEKEY